MSLTLKMHLSGASKNLLGEHNVSYRLDAMSGEENQPWSKYTPSGHLVFTVTNPAAPELAEGEYLVELRRIEPPEAAPDAAAPDEAAPDTAT